MAVPGKKVKQPLSVTHPELAKEAFGWDPNVYHNDRAEKYLWMCSFGHQWESFIHVRKNGRGCPECGKGKGGRKVELGVSDLATTHPDLLSQVSGWNASDYLAGSKAQKEWICKAGHKWIATISNRALNKSGCPYCAGSKPIVGVTDFATQYPEMAKEVDGWNPGEYTSGSNAKMAWKCAFGHKWISTIGSRTNQHTKCPTCRGTKLLKGFNDIATRFPDIASQAEGWDPTEVSVANLKVRWKCKDYGHIWEELISERIAGYNCPYCSGRRLLKGFNDLKTTHPELSKEAFGWDPATVSRGSRVKRKWRCDKNHIWEAQPNDRTGAESGCPFCANKKIEIGFNDISTTHPSLASQAYGWDPQTVMAGSTRIVEWRCSLGHIWKSSPSSRTTQNTGCTICLGKVVLAGYNDLKTTHPEISLEADGWDPETINAGSNKKLGWKCQEGHKWKTQPNSRTGSKTGCPTCANSGFDPNSEAFLYFLSHPNWLMLQIGITNFPDNRLSSHKRLGWELLELRGPMDGHLTQQWETAILRMLKAKGADLSNSKIAGKFDGYSEAWSKSTFEVKSIKELMKLTEEFEEKSTYKETT